MGGEVGLYGECCGDVYCSECVVVLVDCIVVIL